jgi:hypothetical protein
VLLQGLALRLYLACDAPTTLGALAAHVAATDDTQEWARSLVQRMPFDMAINLVLRDAMTRGLPIERVSGEGVAEDVPSILEWLAARGLVAREGERWLGLACRSVDALRFARGREADARELRNLAATRNLSVVDA